jgi:hypothetical protein
MKRRAILPRMIAAENDRDRPTGAGAAPGRQDGQPRAASGRGRRDSRSAKFYAQLAEMPPTLAPAFGAPHSRHPPARQAIIRGDFIGLAHWITCAVPLQPERPHAFSGIDAQTEDPAEGNSELSAVLAAIGDDVHGRAAAARAGIHTDFAGRIKHARKHIPGFARAAAIAALMEARKAALSLLNQNAALELAGRKQVAIAMFGTKHKRENNPRLKIHMPIPPSL